MRRGPAGARVRERSRDQRIKSSFRAPRLTLPVLFRCGPCCNATSHARPDLLAKSNAFYADIGIRRIMPRSGLCRISLRTRGLQGDRVNGVRHNLRGSNNKEHERCLRF